MRKQAVVVGAGVAGMSAAANLAHHGYECIVVEKNAKAGGRAVSFMEQGFVFDKGPSWFWMPDVINSFFKLYGEDMHNYFELQRLDPSYRVVLENHHLDVAANFEVLKKTFESIEEGAGQKLEAFISDAKLKYEISMDGFINKPSISFFEYLEPALLAPAMRLNIFSSFHRHARKYFKHKDILKIIEFPVLFLGGTPHTIPAMYSLMNYADVALGTWYPKGGFSKLSEAMQKVCEKNGVKFHFGERVKDFEVQESTITTIVTDKQKYIADLVVSAADYEHTESLLPTDKRNYSAAYWDSRNLAPSALIFFIGLNIKLPNVLHHNLFFEPDFYEHAKTIYQKIGWPEHPLFYLCAPSKTDETVAPKDCENLFVLIPLNTAMDPDETVVGHFFEKIVQRIKFQTGVDIRGHIVVKHHYTRSNFEADYNAYKGNAYGLSNTLMQTAFLKPSIINKKIKNLFYTGQLTVPGPGIPPSIISGKIVSDHAMKKCSR